MLKSSYSSQTETYPDIPLISYQRIIEYVEKYNFGVVLGAIDKEQNIHAALLCVWDATTAYYLIGGSDNRFKNSGAMNLIMHKAILLSKNAGKQFFNFEGSSLETIEKFLRGFGGTLTPYSQLVKKSSSSLELLKKVKTVKDLNQ